MGLFAYKQPEQLPLQIGIAREEVSGRAGYFRHGVLEEPEQSTLAAGPYFDARVAAFSGYAGEDSQALCTCGATNAVRQRRRSLLLLGESERPGGYLKYQETPVSYVAA